MSPHKIFKNNPFQFDNDTAKTPSSINRTAKATMPDSPFESKEKRATRV